MENALVGELAALLEWHAGQPDEVRVWVLVESRWVDNNGPWHSMSADLWGLVQPLAGPVGEDHFGLRAAVSIGALRSLAGDGQNFVDAPLP